MELLSKKHKWHEIYMRIAYEISTASYAERKKVGAIIVKDNRIISYGYNGTPYGFDNTCEENGITKNEVLHAESNAITKCAMSNESTKNAFLYTTMSPCYDCAKLIIQSGIKCVYYKELYTDTKGLHLLTKAGIETHAI
jgi:dCMP deaminase